jgi:hypothetical protein
MPQGKPQGTPEGQPPRRLVGRNAGSIRARRERAAVANRQALDASWLVRALKASASLGTARNVLTALLLLGKGRRIVEEPATVIADVAGTGLDQTRRCLRELRALGEITIVRRGGGGRLCNIYRLDILPPDESGGAA